MFGYQNLIQEKLLEHNDVSLQTIQKNLDIIAQHQVDYADLYFQHVLFENWQLEEGIVKSGSFSTHQGVGVRAVSAEKTAFAYADSIHPNSLLQASQAVKSIAQTGQSQTAHTGNILPQKSLYDDSNPIASMDAVQKIALLKKIDVLTRKKDPRVIQVIASLSASYEMIYIARLDNKQAGDIRPLVRLSLNVIVEQNNRREQGSAGGGGRFNISYFDENIVQQYIDNAVSQALLNLESRPAPAGQMPVVLGSGWPGVLLHEAVGHGLEGDFNRKATSAFSNKIGQQVAAKGITVVDQGNIPNRRGSLNIDDEGNPTQETILIEDGILVGYMQDEMNAKLMNMPVTGNGRRESYSSIPMPRMTNTFMYNGQYSAEEIISSVDKGIYAVNFGGGQVDITSGRFVFSASEAWLIENGRLQYPIKGATLIGNGPEVMKNISMIGNNLALDSGVGVCGKEGQSVPVGVGQPTLKINTGLTVGGAEL